ncbi:unnamed protein product [Symbiodinium necroappetens]|uniref:Alpha N-terminal protein methyltransferase 1 n=1 Tax=Symbiodinium necroappetens TaxID=1628268 RepID=A0A812PB67_9DINO|nr:unnamed protein product [Symbiodinium necroappetens]
MDTDRTRRPFSVPRVSQTSPAHERRTLFLGRSVVHRRPIGGRPNSQAPAGEPLFTMEKPLVEAWPGTDSTGAAYSSHLDLWNDEEKKSSWYKKTLEHWAAQDATVNGVLGGFPETSEPDLRESRRFLKMVRRPTDPPSQRGTVLDCGAGIGRVTEGLLVHEFGQVDLVEPNARLLEAAREQIRNAKVDRFINSSLEQFQPEEGRYDTIWAQWVLLYLTDDDLVSFFERCKKGLTRDGLIFVKENVVLEGQWIVDRDDNSISRTDAMYKDIFRKAGLVLQHELKQAHWPSDLVPVKMYALRQR